MSSPKNLHRRIRGSCNSSHFGSDLLDSISILTAIPLGQFPVAAIVVLMLSGSEALESFATARASSVVDALARHIASSSHRRENCGLIDIGDIGIGDELTVLPHEICPVDGTVLGRHGEMDKAYLTGKPYEISKTLGSPVISGAINGETLSSTAFGAAVEEAVAPAGSAL